nr:immunoglobulin heavy chain junction region [Macaca mulatta]
CASDLGTYYQDDYGYFYTEGRFDVW